MLPDLAPHDAQLGEDGLLARFVQVLPQGVAEPLLPVGERRIEASEHRAAELFGERGSRAETGFLGCCKGFDALRRGIFELHGGKDYLRPVKWSIVW